MLFRSAFARALPVQTGRAFGRNLAFGPLGALVACARAPPIFTDRPTLAPAGGSGLTRDASGHGLNETARQVFDGLYALKVARLAGFEPTTPWFVAKYSIQLSYSRIKTDIMPWKLKIT